MRRFLLIIVLFVTMSLAAIAQCTMKNTAFKTGEQLSFNLYFNWKFVWYKVGTASMSISNSNYHGQNAMRCNLITRSNGKLDKYFFMRDTLLSYITPQLVPLYYRKGAHEGKRYTVDEVWYNYASNTNHVSMKRLNNDKTITKNEVSTPDCIFDMLSLFLRSRSFNFGEWKLERQQRVSTASGKGRGKGLITYKGKVAIKADDGKKYNCLKLEFAEWSSKKNKYNRLATFYITDDRHHIPVRLDFNLRFGEAKAYLTSMKGIN